MTGGHLSGAAAAPPGAPRDGQVALVTGGSAGLGLAIGAALARAGSDVVLASRSAARCEDAAARVAAETGRTVAGRGCDVTDERAVAGLVDRVLADHGRLDVLVTSAGVQARGSLEQLDVATLRTCLDVNVVGTWLACRAAAPRPGRRCRRGRRRRPGRCRAAAAAGWSRGLMTPQRSGLAVY